MWKILASRARVAACTAVALMAACAWPVTAAATAAPEYQLKAVFLFNFTQFVEWPAAPGAPNTPFVVGVLGEDPFHEALDQTLSGETVNGRPLVLQRYARLEDVGDCQILFVSKSQAGQLDTVLSQLRDRPILTVSDLGDFAGHGGTIEFVTVNNRLRLRINAQSAALARLTISSKLLQLADIVTTQPPPAQRN